MSSILALEILTVLVIATAVGLTALYIWVWYKFVKAAECNTPDDWD